MAARRAAAAATWLWWVLPAVAAGQDVWCNEKAQRLHGGVSSSGGCVHHLADAMPEATAREVHGLLQETWASRGFHYATNCKDPGATAVYQWRLPSLEAAVPGLQRRRWRHR